METSAPTRSHLTVRAPAPDWYHWAVGRPHDSRFVDVAGCPVHYLLWPGDTAEADRRGLLFVHGGGAHANWWSFLAPFFTGHYRVAAMDLSGMGDSGRREVYDSEIRATEMGAVIADAALGPRPYVIGHSFGGFMTMKFGATRGDEIGGAVIVDTPIRVPEEQKRHRPPRMGSKRYYDDFDTALARFRLRPAQPCANQFLVEHIGRHSLKQTERGWTWKFDPVAMGARRFGEPFHEYLQALQCRSAYIHGEQSALVSRQSVAYVSSLMGPASPIVEIPQAQHHLTLDQPLAFVAALRALLDSWSRAEPA